MFGSIRRWRKQNRVIQKIRQFDRALEDIQLTRLRGLSEHFNLTYETKNHHLAVFSTFCGPTRSMSLSMPAKDIGVDFFFISNNEKCLKRASQLGWIPFFLDIGVYDDPIISAHQAKIAKALPHFFSFLQSYDKLFYMDDKFHFSSDFIRALDKIEVKTNYSFVVSYHRFLAKNILFELAEAMGQPRYFSQRERSVTFITRRLEEGLQLNVEHLYETGLILRNLRHPEVNTINEDWYQSILECGIECQLSFDFIAQKYSSIQGFDATLLNSE